MSVKLHLHQLRAVPQVMSVLREQFVERLRNAVFIQLVQRVHRTAEKHIGLPAAQQPRLHFLVVVGIRIADHLDLHIGMAVLKRPYQLPVIAGLVVVPQHHGKHCPARDVCDIALRGAAAQSEQRRQQQQSFFPQRYPSRR